MELRSQAVRKLAPENDPLKIGMGWKVDDLAKPQIMVESTFGDSHPGSAHLDQFVKERYSSYDSGVGKKIVDGEMTLESLADYAEGLKSFDVPSGRQEYLESVVNRVLFH